MSEWWSYGLTDFLMFSPDAYWRLVARHNAAWWPAQLAGLAAVGGLLVLLWRRERRAALLLLAVAWAWVGWSFHWRRYTEIFLGAGWLAGAFALEALLLVAALALPPRTGGMLHPGTRTLGLALAVAALLYPLLAPLTGHPWDQAEVFGLLPQPTALATAGALLALPALPGWSRVLLAVLPVLALLLGAATRSLVG